jgi:hypothetical protein
MQLALMTCVTPASTQFAAPARCVRMFSLLCATQQMSVLMAAYIHAEGKGFPRHVICAHPKHAQLCSTAFAALWFTVDRQLQSTTCKLFTRATWPDRVNKPAAASFSAC